MAFGVEGIRQGKNFEAIDEFAIIERLFDKQIDEAVFELVDLGDGGADLGRPQRNQPQVFAGQFVDFLGKPLNAKVFRTLDRGQGSQHPGHRIEALKEIAHRAVENPAQARQGLDRQCGLAVFDLGKLPLGKAGPACQHHGRNPGRLPQFADPAADTLLDELLEVVRLFSFHVHCFRGPRFPRAGARISSRGP